MILTGGRRCRSLLWREFFEDADPYGVRSCGPMGSVIDLGAHCGMFSLTARFLMPRARMLAVEPDPDNFQALASNVMHLHIDVRHAAIGDGLPVALLNRPRLSTGLVYGDTHSSPTSGVFDRPPEGIKPTIPSMRLQDLWAEWRPEGRVFLKMDMEGAEHHFVGDPSAESCLEKCTIVSGELHEHRKVGPSMKEYESWLRDRFGVCFTVQVQRDPRTRRRALMKMIKLEGT